MFGRGGVRLWVAGLVLVLLASVLAPVPAAAQQKTPPPTGLSVVAEVKELVVSWIAPSASVKHYVVRYRLRNALWQKITHSAPVLSRTISGLTAGSEYAVQVRTIRTDNKKSDWVSGSGTPLPPGPPGPPAQVAVKPIMGGFTLSWQKPEGVNNFVYYKVAWAKRTSTGPDVWGPWTERSLPTARVFSVWDHRGLTAGSTYRVRVQAREDQRQTETQTPAFGPGFGIWSAPQLVVPAVPKDYDVDDDGLIEVDSWAKLKAIGYNLDADAGGVDHISWTSAFPGAAADMGCRSGVCSGYEMTKDLDFDTNDNGSVGAGDFSGGNWSPIGGGITYATQFNAVFDGGGHQIRNLRVARHGLEKAGLFGVVGLGGVVRNLGVVGADVTGGKFTGAVAGELYGNLEQVWSTGTVEASGSEPDYVGGVAGRLGGRAKRVWSSAAVTGRNKVGGLFGQVAATVEPGKKTSVAAAYATGTVRGDDKVGGLVGETNRQSHFTAVYAAGPSGPATPQSPERAASSAMPSPPPG